MSRPPVPTATVALIAAGVIERGVKFGALEQSDFSDYVIPGTQRTYREQTFRAAAKEAWMLVEAVDETRPEHQQ